MKILFRIMQKDGFVPAAVYLSTRWVCRLLNIHTTACRGNPHCKGVTR